MKNIYQTVIEKGSGNCMQAAIASLLDKQLDEVPNFVESENSVMHMFIYLEKLGYDPCYFENHLEDVNLQKILEYDKGVNGYFFGVVESQTHNNQNVFHAIIVDKHLNIIHDPNPNQLAMSLKPKDILRVLTLGNWSIENGQFIP